jgi:ribosomal protein L35AE/L33A
MDKQEKKLRKAMVKADECTSRKKAQKILGKVQKIAHKMAEKLMELS